MNLAEQLLKLTEEIKSFWKGFENLVQAGIIKIGADGDYEIIDLPKFTRLLREINPNISFDRLSDTEKMTFLSRAGNWLDSKHHDLPQSSWNINDPNRRMLGHTA